MVIFWVFVNMYMGLKKNNIKVIYTCISSKGGVILQHDGFPEIITTAENFLSSERKRKRKVK